MHCSSRQFLFVTLLMGLVLLHETRTAPFAKVETAFASWLAAYSPRPATAPLTVIQIADDDLYVTPWPWKPVDYSLFLNAALPFQPSVLAVEPVLAWPKETDGQPTLHHQALRAPKLLLSAEFGFPEDPALVQPIQEVPVLRHVEGKVNGLAEFPLVAAQPGEELRHSAALGFFGTGPAGKGALRRAPLLFRYCGQVVPSFALQAAMLWYGVTPEEVRVTVGRSIDLGTAARIPIDAAGTMQVDFSIPVRRFSFPDLILSAEQRGAGHVTAIPLERLNHSLVLLTRTDRGARDLPLANGRAGSRGDLAAAAIATLQQKRFPHQAPLAVSLGLIAAGLGVGWLVARAGRFAATVICFGGFALYLLGALGIFSLWQVALPLGLPAGLLAFLAVFRQAE